MSQESDKDQSAGQSSVDPKSVEGLFITALAKSSPEERVAFLDEVCGEDAERRRRVEALLRAYDDSGSFLEQPAGDWKNPPEEMSLDFLTSSEKPELLGMLGPYEIMEEIGRGGMGIVLRGLDPKLHRVVAIKVLAPQMAANPNARRRFLREARTVAAISHPHIVTIHAVDEESVPYFVMECIDGQTLQQKLNISGSLQLAEILRISKQIAEGLSAAHRQGLIHRDIKPANILLENGVERVKITDFGLARAVDDVTITRTGEVSGTPEYMSPEQARGDQVDQRSDLFNLGAVMYAMCTGCSPFRGTSMAAVIRKVCDERPRSIREENPAIPDWLIRVVDQLLEKNPTDRFQSADEVATVLEESLAHLQHPDRPAPQISVRGTEPTQAFEAEVVQAGPSERTVKTELVRVSRRLIGIAMLNCFVLLAAFAILAMYPPSGQAKEQLDVILSMVFAVLILSGVICWAAKNMVRLELGHEARINGAVAAALSMISGPGWIFSWPVALSAFSFLKRKEVRIAYSSGGRDPEPASHPTRALSRFTFFGGVGGALPTAVLGLWLASQGTMQSTGPNIAEMFTVVLIAVAIYGIPLMILRLLWRSRHKNESDSVQRQPAETQRPWRERFHEMLGQPGKILTWLAVGILSMFLLVPCLLGVMYMMPKFAARRPVQHTPVRTGTVEIRWDEEMPLYEVFQNTGGSTGGLIRGHSRRVDSNPFLLGLSPGTHLLTLTFIIDGQAQTVQKGVVIKADERITIDGWVEAEALRPVHFPNLVRFGTVKILHDGKTLKSVKVTGAKVPLDTGKEHPPNGNPYMFALPPGDYGVTLSFILDGEKQNVRTAMKLEAGGIVTLDLADLDDFRLEATKGSSVKIAPEAQKSEK